MAELVDVDGRVRYVRPTNQLVVTRGHTAATDRIIGGNTAADGRISPNTYTLDRTRVSTAPKLTSGGSAPKGTTYAAAADTGPSAAEIAAQQAAAAARAAANSSARSGATSDIDRLNGQITANLARRATNQANLDALKGLVEGGHKKTLDNALAALDKALSTKLSQITQTFEGAIGSFRDNLRDNEKSESDSSFSNLVNRGREKQDVVSQALAQGAGESDILRTQLQALRNWSSNQADINRSFFDTRQSVNSGIVDLNTTTQTSMKNEEMSTNAARGQRWDEHYDAMGQSYSDMANLDQNNYLLDAEIGAAEKLKGNATGLLAWLDAGKDAESYQAPKLTSTSAPAPPAYTSPYAAKSAEMASSFWKDPGISKATQGWKGAEQSKGTLNTTLLAGAQPNETVDGTGKKKRPEGATLRKW